MASALIARRREAIRVRHYSIYTEQAYTFWIRRIILFHGKRHPGDVKDTQVAVFLSHLAVQGHVAASTENTALGAIVFLFRHALVP